MMPKQIAARRRKARRPTDLTDAEINAVFKDLRIAEEQRGLAMGTIEQATPMLYFPITIHTPTERPIDW